MLRTSLLLTAAAGLVLSACHDSEVGPTPHVDLQEVVQQAQEPVTPKSYLSAAPGEGYLTPERLNAAPSLGGKRLSGAKISPSGEFATALQGRADDPRQQDLWAYDLTTGEGRLLVSSTDLLGEPEELSAEEKNRRERAREYGSGIISYSWAGDNLLLFPLGGDIYLYDLETSEARQVTATKGFETDPKVSEDGKIVAYVRGNELYIKSLATGLERQLTDGSTDTIRNATASFVVQEELGRNTGYWVSGDATKAAYTQIDEREIAIENRIEFGAGGIENVSQRYPFAGTSNATVKLGVVSTKGGRTKWLDLGDDPDIYLTRVAWAADNRTLYAGVLARDQKTHTIHRYDSRTGKRDVFYEQTSPTWINIRTEIKPQKDGSLLLIAERKNKRQIYRISEDKTITALTPENLNVKSIGCLTEHAAYVAGWQDSPLSTHLFRINLTAPGKTELSQDVEVQEPGQIVADTEKPDVNPAEAEVPDTTSRTEATINAPYVTKLTQKSGQYSAAFNKDCSRYLGGYNSSSTPPNLRAYQADGTPLAWLNENKLDENHPYAKFLGNDIEPEFGLIAADDGTEMDYILFKPKGMKSGEKRASVTIVYNGPGVQRAFDGWSRKMFSRMLAHHGFVVFLVDGRGATNRGKAYEDLLYRSMGRAEVRDQTAGATWLKSQSYIDPDRMGMFGWSYGGYMTLHMLAQTDLYKSGVSGAPVTDWALYDTAYTERFLGDPNPESMNYTKGAYENGSVFPYLDELTEPVLLIHGMADDNVVFRHSIKLMGEMQKNGQHNLRVMTYPGEKHGFRAEANRTHRDREILEFFLDTLDVEKE